MKKILEMLLIATMVVSLSTLVEASMMNAPDVYGLTARGMGVGNAMTAYPGDISDAYFNPAGVALINSGEISLGYIYADPYLQITTQGKTYNDIVPLNRIGEIGYALNLTRLLNRQVVLAQELSVDNNLRTLAEFDDGANPNGNFFRYGYTNLMLLTSVGINVLPWLYVGYGISAYLGANTTMNTTTTLNGQTSNSSISLGTDGKFSSLAGILLTPLGGLVTVGITYREGHIFNLGPISANANATVGGSTLSSLPLDLYFKDGFVPTQWAFGFSFRPSDRLRFMFDLTYYQWSWLNKLESSGDYAKTDISLNMKDTYAPRIGLELQPIDNLYTRIGYQYLPSPLHGSTGTLNWVDSPQQVWSIGAGYNIAPISPEYPVSIDAVYQYHYLNKTSFPFSSGYSAQAKGDINTLGVTLTLRF
jgi:long-subunit fatty acid transport protein